MLVIKIGKKLHVRYITQVSLYTVFMLYYNNNHIILFFEFISALLSQYAYYP